MSLTGETTNPPATAERTPINIAPEAKRALERILYHPRMRGVGFSEFILRAVREAERELEASDNYVTLRRRFVRATSDRELSDEECDALLAKLDEVAHAT